MPRSLRRLAAASVTLIVLGTPALVTSSDAAQPHSGTVQGTYIGDVGPQGVFSLGLKTLSDGRIKVTWKTAIRNRAISKFRIAVSTSRKMDQNVKYYTLSRKKRAAIVNPASLVTPASGDYSFVKLYLYPKSRPKSPYSSPTRWIKAPVTVVPSSAGQVTLGTFNIRTWNGEANLPAVQKWSHRRPNVASEIAASGAGIVGVQEASGTKNGGYGNVRQWQFVLNDLGNGWAVTNPDYYKHPAPNNAVDGLQGTRILYDSDDYMLLDQGYMDVGKPNPSATVWIPWARFEQKSSGLRFTVFSAHLTVDADPAKGPYVMAQLRVAETQKISAKVDDFRATYPGEQVFVLGDMNSTIYTPPNNTVHREFVRQGFYDAFASAVVENGQYPTTNSFVFPVVSSPQRRDYILSKGPLKGAYSYVNRVYQSPDLLASDHYMQVATMPIGIP